MLNSIPYCNASWYPAKLLPNRKVYELYDKKSELESSASNTNFLEYQKKMQLPLIGKEQQGKHTQRNQSPAGAVNPLLQKEIEQLNEIAQKKTINSNKEKDKDTQSNCFSVDYSFLDTISISDPRLQKLLNDDLLNSKNLDLEYILEQNADYFHHLFSTIQQTPRWPIGQAGQPIQSLLLSGSNISSED